MQYMMHHADTVQLWNKMCETSDVHWSNEVESRSLREMEGGVIPLLEEE